MTTVTTPPDATATADPAGIEQELLNAEQAWTICGLSKAAWYKANSAGRIPRPVKIGGAARWRRQELFAWIEAGCPPRAKWDTMAKKK